MSGVNDQLMLISLLQRLVYFDIFSYPLTENELFNYCSFINPDRDEGLRILHKLIDSGVINFNSGYYYLSHDSSVISTRLRDNKRAFDRLKTAHRFSYIISCFPFVRAIFISGSLSKNVMKPDDDIDYFIITEPGRLWLCRTFLTLFKKIFLANSHHNFCLNYFVDSNSLEIPDRNIYTATEIAFLLPVYNYDLYCEFIRSNEWYKTEFPNLRVQEEKVSIRPWAIKKSLERIFHNRFGEWLDNKCFSVISSYWRKKFFWLDEITYAQNMKSERYVSKHHPDSYQSLILNLYEKKRIYMESYAIQSLFNVS